ncbi:MAG: NTP transferase domain-containing protein [Spirochaeta sp.]|nr:NTP transferase domain-containing protein [Spirochaeta sp.]
MKGVILAAGYGTRFLPVTKTIPKEMLPLIMKPAIDFIIEEFLASGIEDILVITSRRKKALEDYLDREMELEYIFEKEKARNKLKNISPPEARFYFIRQQEMLGTGHALMLARPFIGNEPFIVAYPDDLLLGRKPLAVQLIETYEQTGCTVLATIYDPPNIERYGTIAIAAGLFIGFDQLYGQGFAAK